MSLTLTFLTVIVTLYPIALSCGIRLRISALTALTVCLIPTTIGGLLSAIGIAGMDRVARFRVVALSGKAVEACGDVDTMILEVVEIGKQLLITRGSLTAFSLANDVAKYFAMIPAVFMTAVPQLGALNIMRLATPYSAVLSALIFNALIIPCLIPLAMRGVKYRPMSSGKLLWRNMLIYGLGGVLTPFAGIKLIDLFLAPLLLAAGITGM